MHKYNIYIKNEDLVSNQLSDLILKLQDILRDERNVNAEVHLDISFKQEPMICIRVYRNEQKDNTVYAARSNDLNG